MTADELVAAVRSMFDTDDQTALGWVNERQRTLVAQSQWRGASTPLGTTVAGQANYDLPVSVVDVRRIRIDAGDGPVMYDLAGIEQLWQLDDPTQTAYVDGPGGLFAADFSVEQGAQIRLFPAPDVDGADITALAAYEADPMALMQSPADTPIIPADFHRYLLDGAIADGYERIDRRWDLAQPHEDRFTQAAELLRRRRNSRVGSGPHPIGLRRYR